MLNRLAPVLVRRRRAVIAVWGLFLVLAVFVGSGTTDRLITTSDGDPSSESARAEEILEDAGLSSPEVVALIDGAPVDDPTMVVEVTDAAEAVAGLDGVESVATTYSDGPLYASVDGNASLVAVTLDQSLSGADFDTTVHEVAALLAQIEAPDVVIGGEAILAEESVQQTEEDLQRAELLTLPLTLALAVFVFGGLLAASLPLMVALMAVPGSLAVLWGVSTITDVHVFALNAATMLGLGLAIDYSLLIVNRFREERAAGSPVAAAVERTVATAGVTVAFSGLTVAVALGGFLMFKDNVFPSIGLGSIGVVILAMLAAMTLLPAVLATIGHRIRPARSNANSGRVFHRIATLVQRRPLLITIGVSGILLILAIPFFSARLQIPGAESLPASSETRQLLDERDARFLVGGEDPITVVAHTDNATGLVGQIRELDGAAAAQIRTADLEGIVLIDVLPAGPAQGAVAESVVQSIRALEPGYETEVTGPAAWLIDERDALFERLPWALLFVAVATLVLLFLLTGSVILPFKAMAMNLLSLTATFGILVWGFQNGGLEGVLGFESVGFLSLWLPFLIFFISFGLSMDYEVFLLARIREIHEETGDNDQAVSLGLQRTGRIVTSAALLIAIVFGAFATGESVEMKALGVGLAVAILLDAFVIRIFLVPAAMKLMGEWNWWAPAPLRRLHNRIGLHEPPSAPTIDLTGSPPAAGAESERELVEA
jgi:RND superfamily putative drug exporter